MRLNAFKFGTIIVLHIFSPNLCSAQEAAAVPETSKVQLPKTSEWVTTLFEDLSGNLLATSDHQNSAASEATAAVAAQKDYTIQTGSISSLSTNGSSSGTPRTESEQVPLCVSIPAPPAMLQTQSKYRVDDKSKSSVDAEALEARDRSVQPIRNSIRLLTNIAYAASNNSVVAQARAECVLHNVDRWASAKALTDMRTVDAYLSRDRWVAEIALAVRSASKQVKLSSERRALYSTWFSRLARDTMDAYSFRLGPKSKTNNHRYWAGLSVAAVGFLLDNADFKTWGKTSFEIGACQVDDRGFLPAELSRGEKALDYHVYALRPLAAIIKLASDSGEPLQSRCLDRFKRLTAMTREALQDPTEFERVAGQRQATISSETSYSAALKLDGLPLL
ncbi:alginate lyase protein (plasmid) [Rhizobium etli 8C-3]|uniref:Alginate lyase protein n=1 Tax=Rhizobium etli 8C-3 TaxID=538025 RepID=A0A1L5PHC6_RHIET|nr:alginate lyase family protein [Rhizobium etli]APO79618.1 alginate lyase protein [Rhizobium etli 8C-3]